MPAERYDLTRENSYGYDHPIEVGKTFTLSISVEEDLTGATVRMKVRSSWTDTGTPILNLSSPSSGIVLTPGATSTIVVTVVPATTAGLQARTEDLEKELGSDYALAVYDLEVEKSTGVIEGYLYGDVEIVPEANN